MKEMPKLFHIIQDKDSNYFCVDREMENAWDIKGNYLGELLCEKVENGWQFRLKDDENTNQEMS